MLIAKPFFQQVTGTKVISLYAPVLFRTIVLGQSASLLSAVVTGMVGAISTFISMLMVDKQLGRRTVFVIGGLQMLISQVLVGAVMAFKLGDHGGLSKPCAYLVLVMVCVYVSEFGWSCGPPRWLVPSEIYPLEIRSAGQSIKVAVDFLFIFLVAQTFLSMLCHLNEPQLLVTFPTKVKLLSSTLEAASLVTYDFCGFCILSFWLGPPWPINSMPSPFSPQWQDRATGLFSSSGVKLKEAGHNAKGNVAEVAERVGSIVKSRWALLQQPSTRHAVQERLIEAAASTGSFLRKGISETKDKVSVGKTKVEEVAKITAQRSKTIMTDIERWQKGVASTDVFGVPIEITIQRQQSSVLVPHILVKCADYLVLSGLNSPNLFKAEGDKKVIQQLVSLYNMDLNTSLPEGTNPLDVATLAKCYLASLPEPLTTFRLYEEIRGARSSINAMRNILKKLPNMDVRTLAMEMAPVIMWQEGQKLEFYKQYWSDWQKTQQNQNEMPSYTAWDMLEEEDGTVDPIPLDDGAPIDYGAIEVIQCLIEHHNAIFTDANETVWR
ncbi:hypothetical protein CDL15_Pgr021874 [Punica granatum]|uniref:Rho-GAP domain-containing protein n=1 Tax=Punica granatum TaxID=22663 RepID=A0A218WT72_PUNGR|nr:hypothetical protein CDL15_Pgr021874 [Punica granatum]